MTSRGNGQRLVTAAAALAILFLLLLIVFLWTGVGLGVFTTSAGQQRYSSDDTTQTTSSSTSRTPVNTYPRRPSYADNVNQPEVVEYVRPIKTAPPPLHEHDLLYGGGIRGRPSSVSVSGHERVPQQPLLRHHSGHFRHKMASIWDPHPQYEFAAFGKQFHLVLAHASNFVIPRLKVTHLWQNTSREEHPGLRPEGCFYTGTVRGDPHSAVAVSLCHGMTGHIRTSNGSYFIEPIEEWNSHEVPITHAVYRVPSIPGINAAQDGPLPPPLNTVDRRYPVDDEFDDEGYVEDEAEYFNDTSHHIGRRRVKRSPSQEYFIEIMVVADSKMSDYHGSELNAYVLTLMSIVALIYKDASIGNPVNIAVVKLFVLKDIQLATRHHQQNGISASDMLHKFCTWQRKHNDPNDASPHHHDSALLLTRENICRNPTHKKCDTLGLAELGTMCDKSSSCALVQDNGLSAAFTIAHELGHVLNMPHDDDVKCIPYHGSKRMQNVMSRMLDNNTYPWAWSNCSRHFLTEYLDAGYGDCLMDEPLNDILSKRVESGQLPGEDFTENRQCEFVYGRGSKICSYMPVCKQLWCTNAVGEQEGCRTQHMPWADGTPCGDRHWCQKGECVTRDRFALQPVNGAWGEWQPFGDCSRTCGGGIKRAFRDCNNPAPANGGRYCVGRRVKYRSCGTKDCPPGTPDFREQQCAVFNNNNFNIYGLSKDVKWVPKYGGIGPDDRCKLYCRVAETGEYYLLKDKVIDGTQCGPDTFDICVNGICRQAGCNHYLGSTTQLDYCGQCGGNNSSCQQVSGQYNTSQYGYSRLLRVPAGSSNLDVRQSGYGGSNKDDNYLALVDSETDKYILNGNFIVSMFNKQILYGGTTLEYSGSDAIVERINCSRPLTKDLIVEILSVGNLYPPDVVYQYTVQKSSLAHYMWELSDSWSSCNKVCNGEKQQLVQCVKVDTRQEVSSEFCNGLEQPQSPTQPCNNHCVLKWQVISQSECSTHCGEGTRSLTVQCVQQFLAYKSSSPLHNSSCSHLPRPPSHQPCVGPCDVARWHFTEWGSCSKTCGTGIQSRAAECVDEMGHEMDESNCRESEKIVERICSTQKCPQWSVGEWTPCSVTCGDGERHRPYWCELDNRVVSPDYCSPENLPEHKEVCHLEKCASWITGEWSQCSVSCGVGVKSRSVICSVEGACSLNTKPPVSESCIQQTCSLPHENAIPDVESHDKHHSFVWRTEDWGPCSVTCGDGVRRRPIVCYDEISHKATDSRSCSHLQKPPMLTTCHERPCARWRAGEWGPCSASCGTGTEIRAVACMAEGRDADPRECSGESPESERACHVLCTTPTPPDGNYMWRTGPWSECSEDCGGGVMNRLVVCQKEGSTEMNAPASNCKDIRPVSSVPCNTHPCNHNAAWNFGAWSQCNQTCGGGYQHRQVRCQNSIGVILPDTACPQAQRPSHMQECDTPPCEHIYTYQWNSLQWGPCSRTCGKGVRQRKVLCIIAGQGTVVNPLLCSGIRKPKVVASCRRQPCPLEWVEGEWSQCSVTCGRGYQQRAVTCRQVNELNWVDPDPVADILCDTTIKPETKRSCQSSVCHADYSWVPGPWQSCSHSCGKKGRQIRRLLCYHKDGKKVHRKHCSKDLRPPRKRRCNVKKCGFSSCHEIQQKLGAHVDKEYTLTVAGRNLSIYCHGMNTARPVEYLTLPAGERENYAQFYENRLLDPNTCPFNGHRKEPCPCVNHPESKAGLTVFWKVRFNISSLRVFSNDWTFSRQVKGARIPFGEAGDCYSRARCPQGRFSINLTGTGLRVSMKTVWKSHGPYSSLEVNKLEENRKVMGKCGGYCGTCSPEYGLKLDILPP